jgi:hypothetical protein
MGFTPHPCIGGCFPIFDGTCAAGGCFTSGGCFTMIAGTAFTMNVCAFGGAALAIYACTRDACTAGGVAIDERAATR